MRSIYLDNAASAPILDSVVESMIDALKNLNGNPSSIHRHGRKGRAAIEKSRKQIAQRLQASIGEIFFTSGATEANNTVFNCAATQLGVERFVISSIEHPSVINAATSVAKILGLQVVKLNVNRYGQINLLDLEEVLKSSTEKTLVSIMHANNEIGTLEPIDEIGELCKTYHALFHTDAVQTVAHLPIDLSNNHISFLSASAHKFHGPKGIGFLYVNNANMIEPFIRGGSQERNVRAGTENVAGIVGMATAFEHCCEHLAENSTRITELRTYFIEKIRKELPEIELISPESTDDCLFTIINLHVPASKKSDLLLMNLDIAGVSASGGSACSSGAEKPSHVIEALGYFPPKGKSVRFSLSFLNTKEELHQAVDALKKFM